MKNLLAMQMVVMRMLAGEARAAGRDPSSDPVPGLVRDVLLVSTADEEAGGKLGAGWIASNRPELLRAAGAINECGGMSLHVGEDVLYPVQVAEKGVGIYRITVHGESGHGSIPREHNAVVLAAEVIRRLAAPGPIRLVNSMRRTLDAAAAGVSGPAARILRLMAKDPARGETAMDRTCDPADARLLHALVRDTSSPNVMHGGLKGNVIPGTATIEVDFRPLPGMTEDLTRRELRSRLGDLGSRCSVELDWFGPPAESSADTDLYRTISDTLSAHDPTGTVVPFMAPFSTDAKYTTSLGTPTYGFSPMRLPAGERLLDRFHGVDERVSVAGLRWGLPVLYDVVRRFCA